MPLLLLAAVYGAVTVAILPILWRQRRQAHALDWAVVLVFPGIAFAAGVFGVVAIGEGRPVRRPHLALVRGDSGGTCARPAAPHPLA